MRITARIITGSVEYVKELTTNYMRSPIWKICCETMNQFESEQYILSKGFLPAGGTVWKAGHPYLVGESCIGSTVHVPGCSCGFCKMGYTKA